MSHSVELESRISGGETSSVFLARDGGQQLAVKLLNPHMATDPIVKARFLREGELLATVRHPHIVRVFDVTEIDSQPAIIMEHLGGGSLRGRILSPGEAMDLLQKLALALGEIHRRGVVHRDVRPEHVLFGEDGEPRLIDFGMASVKDLSGLTRSTVFSARPSFVDPYTWGRGQATPLADIYSLGAVIHTALVGKAPPAAVFARRDDPGRDVLIAKMEEKAGSPLGEIVRSMMGSPASRPRNAAEIADWISSSRRSGVRNRTHCLYCSALMPVEAPVCLECGRAPLQVMPDPSGECIVLRKMSEKQEILGPFLAKLKVLAEEPYVEPRLIIGDSRLYSRAEQKSGTRLPVRIAEGIHESSVEPLIDLLRGDGASAIRITRYPMSQRSRFRRGPLITIRSGTILPESAMSDLRSLAARPRSSAGTLSDLRMDCKYAVSLAVRCLASSPASAHLADSERITHLWSLLDSALSGLERSHAYLSGVNLQDLYADLERLDAATEPASGNADERKRIVALFADHADMERNTAVLQDRIVAACRILEGITPDSATEDLRRFESVLG